MWAAAFILVLMAAPLGVQDDVACKATVLEDSWNLLALANYGNSRFERAAFIVRDQSGELHLLRWRFSHQQLAAHYEGKIPSNAVAITHTHPNTSPLPSIDDVAVARRTGLPVYVLTRTQITVTDGRRNRVLVDGDWGPLQSGDQVSGGCDTTAAR